MTVDTDGDDANVVVLVEFARTFAVAILVPSSVAVLLFTFVTTAPLLSSSEEEELEESAKRAAADASSTLRACSD